MAGDVWLGKSDDSMVAGSGQVGAVGPFAAAFSGAAFFFEGAFLAAGFSPPDFLGIILP